MRATSTIFASAVSALTLAFACPAGQAGAQPPQKPAGRLIGVATIYSSDYRGVTASGQRYDPRKFTAAHRTLPFGTRLKITDPRSGRSVGDGAPSASRPTSGLRRQVIGPNDATMRS